MSIRLGVAPMIALITAACGNGPTDPARCATVALPLSGALAGPVVVDVGLEVQSTGIVAVATATDPQGTANLANVLQIIGVFPDANCVGTPITIQDDLVGSGVEETFGTVVGASANPALYSAISAASHWPVTVDFQDRDGNHTVGRALAEVRR